jgi:hypothetical protein
MLENNLFDTEEENGLHLLGGKTTLERNFSVFQDTSIALVLWRVRITLFVLPILNSSFF